MKSEGSKLIGKTRAKTIFRHFFYVQAILLMGMLPTYVLVKYLFTSYNPIVDTLIVYAGMFPTTVLYGFIIGARAWKNRPGSK